MDAKMQYEWTIVQAVARAIGYKAEKEWVSYWRMTSRRDYLEIQMHFLGQSVEMYALSLDIDEQEPLAEGKAKFPDVSEMIREAKKIRNEAVGSGMSEHLRLEHGLNATRRARVGTSFTDVELEKMAKEYKAELEKRTGWKVEKVVKPSFSYGGKTELTAVVSGWHKGTSLDEFSRRVSPIAEKSFEESGDVSEKLRRKYPGVEFGLAGGSTGEKMASRRKNMKKSCDTCGCGILADSLIAPMSADEKDAEAGPKEGPPAMVQPLRARRDYGAVEAKVASMITADLVLSDKDKAVLDAFYNGEKADSKKLSTDGKTLDGNWMGGNGLATRSADGTVTPGEGRPHVKSDEVVLRALKKAVPGRYYKGSYEGVIERIAVSMAQQYDSLYEAADVTGNDGYEIGRTEVWYMKPDFFRDGSMGFEWLQKKGLLPDPKKLDKTHVFLGRIKESSLGNIFRMMQGESWSPMGQANQFIRRKGLHHTSMSVGDVVWVGGKALLVDMMGFEALPEVVV